MNSLERQNELFDKTNSLEEKSFDNSNKQTNGNT